MSKAAYEIHEPIQATVVLDPNQPQALSGGGGDLVTKLQQLDQSHREGFLSDSEFADAKAAALNSFTTRGGATDAEAPDEAGHDVSKKLEQVEENDPRSQCSGPLILVSSGDPYAIRVAEARALLRGGTVEMRLASHPGLVVGRKYPEERRFQEWRYTESAINQGPAIRVSYEAGQGFLKLADAELVLDVSFWKMHQGNTVNFVGGPTANRTRLGGGGRDWTVREDGTIAARHSPHLVLGTRPPPGVKGAGYEENFARICFPVAGHPDYDQGAYHEPCGLCCYTTRRHEHDYPDDEIVGNVIGFPLLLGLYAGTLCYQPCGCICAHQCPWLGDCTL